MTSTFLKGGGDMGAMIRAADWDATPVGAPERWPQSLRTAVSLVLESKFPMLLCWGPEFTQFYNDPFRPILGATKHPAIGKSTRDVFAEAWHIVGPLFARVMGGEAIGFEDMLVPLDRNGFLEDCYFTYSYSPIRAEDGEIAGVFVTCTETTGRVVGERRLRLLQELAADTVAGTPEEVCHRAAAVLARGTADVPFAAIHLLDGDGVTLRHVAACGAVLDDRFAWPVRQALETGTLIVAGDAGAQGERAFVAPILASGRAATGVLVAGVRPTLPLDDQYRGFVTLVARGIGTSVAHAKALADEKRRAEALAEIDRAKTTFFSNVSHEFRTPLTLLLGPIEDALGRDDKSLGGDDLAMVHRNALRLLKLVNTLLDFARIEADRASAVFEPVDLPQLTADLASTFRSAMTRAGLQFDVECPPLPAPVAVDRGAWEKIVLNLLSNALKFTFDGAVRVSLRQIEDGQIELRVRDSGVGIPAEEIPRLFDRFHRVRGARGRTHEGSGIGLALVHELVKMHGGAVSVTSEPGRGTMFTVTFPATRAESAGGGPAHAADAAARPYVEEALRWLPETAGVSLANEDRRHAGAQRPGILLADDNRDVRDYVERLLSDRYVVDAVADGLAALEAARRAPPALILSDVMMPRMDGFALLRELRADPVTRDVPVILLSARAGEDSSLEGLTAGADDYLVKPFSARELRARVDAQVHRAEMRAVLAARDRQMAEMFRLAPVAIAMLRSPDHVFEFVNDEYTRVVGRRGLDGRKILDAIPELADQGIGILLDDVCRSAQPYAADSLQLTLHRGPDGAAQQAYFNFLLQPIANAAGAVERIAIVAVEVTELARARHDAEAANRAKDQFLAVLGHELRNPLAPILTATRLLELQGPKDPHLQRLRETITRQATYMLKLVEDLLDVGRIITGKLRLHKTRVEVGLLVKQAVEASSAAIERGGHALDVTVPDRPVYLDADAGRITQVLNNLLHNAAKFMPHPGRIELAVTDNAGTLAIRVRDQGIGIAPDMLERVFDRFVQAAAFDDRTSEGLGIGLSVVRTIVELHGGSVVARSDGPGKGSEFTVVLPVAAPVSSDAVAVH